ncbi:MAG: AMIN domain-containing protein, partial [Rhodanobacter sp.]
MRLASRCLMIGLLIGSAAWANAAAATATLKSISVDKLPGGRVELHMNFDNGPVPQPRIFTTDNPPRIAVDFADTVNNASRHIDIGEGSTSGVSAVSAGDRTRVVVELMRDSTYHSVVEGNSLVLTVNNGTEARPVTTAATIDPSKALPSSVADGTAVSNIDFRRGENGAGRVLITFNGPGANADMQHQGNKLVVSLGHVQLPMNLAQRLDVLDFATPVQSIATKATPSGARMEIAIKGEVDTSSYQTGDQYVIEVAPKKLSASGRANGSDPTQQPVYTGTRATFNFQDVSVRAVLQLVADESGINLVASDTVGGSITLRLNNVPWDQALDVILRAKGLDKRQDGNVIWIAPQKELADYEQGVAEA